MTQAGHLAGLKEKTALVHAGLRALIEKKSRERLAALGGTQPQMKPAHRRRG